MHMYQDNGKSRPPCRVFWLMLGAPVKASEVRELYVAFWQFGGVGGISFYLHSVEQDKRFHLAVFTAMCMRNTLLFEPQIQCQMRQMGGITLLGLYFSYGISNFVHNPQTGSTSSNFTVLPHCYSGVCLSVTVNYMCILKKKSIGKGIPG